MNFIDRDTTTFIKARQTSRLGWENRLESNSPYARYLLGKTDIVGKAQQLAHAYRTARQIVSTVAGTKVPVAVHPDTSCASADRRIWLSTRVLDDTTLPYEEQLDVLFGEAAHEAAHIAYTDFEALCYPVRSAEGRMKHTIANILEDERIERQIGEDYPGYSRFLEKTKHYYFDRLFCKSLPNYDSLRDHERLFLVFFRLVRYPRYLRPEEQTQFAAAIQQIIHTLTPYPEDCQRLAQAVERIYDILSAFIPPTAAPVDAAPVDTAPSPETRPEENRANGPDSSAERVAAQRVPGDQDDGTAVDQISPASVLNSIKARPAGSVAEDLAPLLDTLNRTLDSSTTQDTNKNVLLCEAITSPLTAQLLQGEVEQLHTDCYLEKQFGRPDAAVRYHNDRQVVAPLVRRLSHALRLNHRHGVSIERNLRRGTLDTSKLVEGRLGVPGVYLQKRAQKNKPLAIGLLIDESGSMRGDKLNAARQCAVLFKEAVANIAQLELFIYGHAADDHRPGSTELYCYWEPGHHPAHALTDLNDRYGNRDGVAIQQTAKRIRRFTTSECVLFVLSDGAPFAEDYPPATGVAHTGQVVKQVERQGFSVMQIAIEPHVPSAQMFTHFVTLTNLDELTRDLSIRLKSVILSKM